MASYDITSDSELEDAVRADTGYESSDVDDTRLGTIIESAKRTIKLKTGATDWYSDDGLGHALFGYTCIRLKSSVENIPLASYDLLDEQVTFDTDSTEDSIQMQQWHNDVQLGLDESDATSQNSRLPSNSADYIGETYIREYDRYHTNR